MEKYIDTFLIRLSRLGEDSQRPKALQEWLGMLPPKPRQKALAIIAGYENSPEEFLELFSRLFSLLPKATPRDLKEVRYWRKIQWRWRNGKYTTLALDEYAPFGAWIKMLPPKFEQRLCNLLPPNQMVKGRQVIAFIWMHTPEWHEYWSKINDRWCNGEFLPQTPNENETAAI